ncbi:MAG: hypothetical protein WCV71_00905 [Patescibacteria group bacterium]
MQKKETFKYEEKSYYKPFDYINKDLDLLFILIFIEEFKRQNNELNFGNFFKGNYWDIDQVNDEVMDTNDYQSVSDMVLEQALFIFEDIRIGKIIEVGIDNTDESIKDLLVEVAKIGPENAKKDAPNYYYPFEQLFFIANQEREVRLKQLEQNPDLDIGIFLKDKSVFFTKEHGYFRALQPFIIDIPTHILIRVKYNATKIKEIEKEIFDYLEDFSNDKYIEKLPRYQEKRLYFAQQIENFYRYVSRLNLIGDTINIPFTILNESGFETVKILRFLELKEVIKIRWSDEGSWKVQFTKLPITPESLLGIKSENAKTYTSLKSGLAYDETSSTLTIGEYNIKINGPDQKDFIRIIFKNQKELNKEWFFSEICEIFDPAMDNNDKKFYNASYQVNLKIAQKTLIKDFLLTTKHSVRVNPKYINS